MRVLLVCVAKEEDNYIEEWVMYHRKLGFDHIFMYENDWKCKLDLPFLTKIEYPGLHKQMESYNHFLNTHRSNEDWVAFFDCDEFLVLKKHNTIQEFITEYNNPFGLAINWQLYGSNGKRDRTVNGNSLIKQFTKRQNGVNLHVKTILNLNSNSRMAIPHHPRTPLMDTNRKFFNGPFNVNGPVDVAVLNHYHHKTYEDWVIKCDRGFADHSPKIFPEQWEDVKNINCEVEDLLAYNFMYGN